MFVSCTALYSSTRFNKQGMHTALSLSFVNLELICFTQIWSGCGFLACEKVLYKDYEVIWDNYYLKEILWPDMMTHCLSIGKEGRIVFFLALFVFFSYMVFISNHVSYSLAFSKVTCTSHTSLSIQDSDFQWMNLNSRNTVWKFLHLNLCGAALKSASLKC